MGERPVDLASAGHLDEPDRLAFGLLLLLLLHPADSAPTACSRTCSTQTQERAPVDHGSNQERETQAVSLLLLSRRH